MLFPTAASAQVHRDIEKTVSDIARYSHKDAETWRALMKRFLAQRDAITGSMFSPPPSFPTAAAGFAASPAGMEAYRFSMQSVRSWANQTLEAEATKTLFGSFATFLGASPDDACGAELGWLFASVLQNVGNNLVKGGMNRVTLALAEYLQAHGGEIRTQRPRRENSGRRKTRHCRTANEWRGNSSRSAGRLERGPGSPCSRPAPRRDGGVENGKGRWSNAAATFRCCYVRRA